MIHGVECGTKWKYIVIYGENVIKKNIYNKKIKVDKLLSSTF
jgi:hypothetical protein